MISGFLFCVRICAWIEIFVKLIHRFYKKNLIFLESVKFLYKIYIL